MPTNVVLYAAGDQVGADGLSLETAAGVRVPITVSPALPTGFDVTPAFELEPSQHYVLRHPGLSVFAEGPLNTSVEFETGSGPAAPAELPLPDLTSSAVLSVDSPCPNERLCLQPGAADSALFAGNALVYLSERSPGTLTGAYRTTFVAADCLQVWRRDGLGNRSEAVELCAVDVARVELSGDAASTTCEEYRHDLLDTSGPDDAGCALAPMGAPPSSRGALGAVYALLAVLGASSLRSRCRPKLR